MTGKDLRPKKETKTIDSASDFLSTSSGYGSRGTDILQLPCRIWHSVVACLLHPKVLVYILPHLKEKTARAILNTEAMPRSEDPPRQLVTYQTVDAHIHLDQ